jgi:hypothetical protein
MSATSAAQGASDPHPETWQARRTLALKRAFQRELGAKPTTLQATLMDRAAILTAKAEMAAFDSETSVNDIVRLDNRAKQAREEMFAAIKRKRHAAGPSLGELLAQQAAAR